MHRSDHISCCPRLSDRTDVILCHVFDLALACLTDLNVSQRVSSSPGIVESLYGICSLLTFLAISRRDPRSLTRFTVNFGCALKSNLDPTTLGSAVQLSLSTWNLNMLQVAYRVIQADRSGMMSSSKVSENIEEVFTKQ